MLIINTITQSGAFNYTQSVCSGAFVTLVIEHWLTVFLDVSNHQHSLISITTISKLVSDMSNSVRGYLNSSTVCRFQIHVHASCSHNGLSNPYTCIRWVTSQIGYLKLMITGSILSDPLDFEIKRVACILMCTNGEVYMFSKTGFIIYLLQEGKKAIKYNYFYQGKIEFGQGKSSEKSGNVCLPHCWQPWATIKGQVGH